MSKKESIKTVAEMSISDVIQMPLFFQNAKTTLATVWSDRTKARKKAHSNNQVLKSHPIDKLHADGELEPGQFIVEYANVLEKQSKYPRQTRDFILGVGNAIFNKTMQTLLEDEKKRDNSNGNDKQ